MIVFLLIIICLPILNLAWWGWADLRLRRLPHARRWRVLLAAFILGNLGLFAWLMLSRRWRLPDAIPAAVLTASYVWHLLVLPATMLLLTGSGLLRTLRAATSFAVRQVRALRTADPPEHGREAAPMASPDPPPSAHAPALTRRQALAAVAVAASPLAMVVGQVRALSQLASLRVRHFDVVLRALPAAFEGLTIAHVSDVHVGRFTRGPILRELVARTNALGPDLILFTGDLIDYSLADLPTGLAMLRQLVPQERLFLCEGNHDLFAGREEFEQSVRGAGLPLLLNETAELEIRGQPVQILGLRWGRPGADRGSSLEDQLADLLPLRRPEAFTILLAHHPHAFDSAAKAGIPLTLSGHTHGGQLMLTQNIGAGPLLFKYWSGLYRKGPATLAVSNGVGNWLPLRINAPAEILHLTLRAGERAIR